MLAGEGADRFATREGLAPENLLTDQSRTMWQNWIAKHPAAQLHDELTFPPPENLEEDLPFLPPEETLPHNRFHDTVGVLAIDERGQMAGACSTSGLPFKVPGRVGDSPIIGHGLYVDPRRGAAVCTGDGELIMGVCGGFLAVERMGRGRRDAAREVLDAFSTVTNCVGNVRWRSSRWIPPDGGAPRHCGPVIRRRCGPTDATSWFRPKRCCCHNFF